MTEPSPEALYPTDAVYPDDLPAIDPPCCLGAWARGPHGCTCWAPVYDQEQQPLQLDVAREEMPRQCVGCAFRPGTRANEAQVLTGLGIQAGPFHCHLGTRRLVAWAHPSGLVHPHGEPEHDPPTNTAGAPFLANGRPSPLCAGWVDGADTWRPILEAEAAAGVRRYGCGGVDDTDQAMDR